MELTFYGDNGHGWLAVPVQHVKRLRVKVSRFSYKRDGMAYLEEDQDAGAFLAALEKAGESFVIHEIFINGEAAIRTYPAYR